MVGKAVIDFSAFVGKDGSAVIKELSILDVDTMCVQHWIFKPPVENSPSGWTDTLRHNRWLSKHYHGVDFEAGFTDYSALERVLESTCCDIPLLFTSTLDKAKTLVKLFQSQRAVFSLEELGCPKVPNEILPTIPEEGEVKEEDEERELPCLWHHLYAPGFNCTQANVRRMALWCAKNKAAMDMNEVAIRERTFVNWSLQQPTPRMLAEQGFVHLAGTKDSTRCVYCGVHLFRWEHDDDVASDHEYNSPFCKYAIYKQQQQGKPMVDIPVSVIPAPKKVTESELIELCRA